MKAKVLSSVLFSLLNQTISVKNRSPSQPAHFVLRVAGMGRIAVLPRPDGSRVQLDEQNMDFIFPQCRAGTSTPPNA
jgi:hypothetical protein